MSGCMTPHATPLSASSSAPTSIRIDCARPARDSQAAARAGSEESGDARVRISQRPLGIGQRPQNQSTPAESVNGSGARLDDAVQERLEGQRGAAIEGLRGRGGGAVTDCRNAVSI
jgi:hypothetical protein